MRLAACPHGSGAGIGFILPLELHALKKRSAIKPTLESGSGAAIDEYYPDGSLLVPMKGNRLWHHGKKQKEQTMQ